MTAALDDGFEEFFRSEHARVIALGMAITGDRELSKELAQESFLRAFRDWRRVSVLDRPDRWVRRVAVNLAVDHHRRARSARRSAGRLRPLAAATLPDPLDDWWTAVRELPERERAAVALHYLDDVSVAEVARILGVTTGTVTSSLAHARRKLAARLTSSGAPDHHEETR